MKENKLTSTLIERDQLNILEYADFFVKNFENPKYRFYENMSFFAQWVDERITILCQENNISTSKEEVEKTRMYIIAQIIKEHES